MSRRVIEAALHSRGSLSLTECSLKLWDEAPGPAALLRIRRTVQAEAMNTDREAAERPRQRTVGPDPPQTRLTHASAPGCRNACFPSTTAV
jgi:hypothetical protein